MLAPSNLRAITVVCRLRIWVTAIVLVAVLAMISSRCFAADPQLEIAANRLRPIIAKLEAYQKEHGSYPRSLKAIGVDDKSTSGPMPEIGYLAETGSNGNGEIDFEDSDTSKKIIGYELYIDLPNGGLFYVHTDSKPGWYFNSGEERKKVNL